MEPITNVAAGIGIDADDLELYGKYKAKPVSYTHLDVYKRQEAHSPRDRVT